MNIPADATDYSAPDMTESIAQVVAVEGGFAWLIPEQSSGCGSCASASACGSRSIDPASSRLDKRRFQICNDAGLRVGERVVFGIRENVLLKASITAYAIPLAVMVLAGVLAQWKFESDLATLCAAIAGLAAGLGISRLVAGRMQTHGELAPLFLRRARPGETCGH
jgi:sigma-E factor negative regulatory protein RseC